MQIHFICKGSNIKIKATSSGGVVANYTYTWNNSLPALQSHSVSPASLTKYRVTLKDNCSDSAIDSILVNVMPALKIKGLKDSSICRGQSAPLNTIASGGRSSSYTYTWNNGLGNNASHLVVPSSTTVYRVILSDGCTITSDTSFIKISVSNPLSVKLNTSDTLICYDKSATLSASASGGNNNYTYTWNNGLGSGNAKTISLKTNTWLKVTATDGCTVIPASDSMLIKVRATLSVSLNNDSTICKGTFINLLAQPSGGDATQYSYIWSPTLPAVKANTVSPATTKKYLLTLKDNCSNDAVDSVVINVLPALKIAGLKDTTICYGGSAVFNPVVSGGIASQYVYQWNKSLGNTATQTVTPLVSTNYKLTVKDNCTNPADSMTVTVTVRPALKITKLLSKNTICSGDSSQLTLNLTGGISSQYNWTINGASGSGNTLILKPTSLTHYDLKLTDNCSDPDTTGFDINVNSLPFVDFDADKQSVCQGASVQFNNKSTGASAYLWQFTATDKSTIPSPVFTYRNQGTFDVSLQASTAAGCKASLNRTAYINVVKLPVSHFTFTPDNATYLNPDISFSNISTDYTMFQWDFGDGQTDNINSDPVHSYSDTGTYKVLLTTKNSLGCAVVSEKYVRIKDVYSLYIPNAITVNGDGINEELVYNGRGIDMIEYSLYNRWGEKIFESVASGSRFTGIDSKGQPLMKGTYLLIMTVRDFSGKVYYIKQTLELL